MSDHPVTLAEATRFVGSGHFKDAEELLKQVRQNAHRDGQARVRQLESSLQQYADELAQAYEMCGALCAKLSAEQSRHDAIVVKKDARIAKLEKEVLRLAHLAASNSPPPSSSPSRKTGRKLPPTPPSSDDDDDSNAVGNGTNPRDAIHIVSPRSPVSPIRTEPLRNLSHTLAKTPKNTPPPAVPARRTRRNQKQGKHSDTVPRVLHAAALGPNQKHATLLRDAIANFVQAIKPYTTTAANIAKQHVVGRIAENLKVPLAKSICTQHATFVQHLTQSESPADILTLIATANQNFAQSYGALMQHTCQLEADMAQHMTGNASDMFLERYSTFLSAAESFIADTWRQQCKALLDKVECVFVEMDSEAGLSPITCAFEGVGLSGQRRELLQQLMVTTREIRSLLNKAKSAQVCSAIPALADVVRDARLRLQCAGMTYFKPASESGYLSNLFKRGSREVDVDCYLFDGYFVAIEKPDDQGEIVALLIPTTEDLGISVQHKNKALQLESRDAFVVHGHSDNEKAQNLVGEQSRLSGHEFMFTVPEGATLRSSTAVGTQLRLSLPSRSQTIANWEKEITECALEQSSNKKLVDQIIPWVAAGHLDKIQGALKNRHEGVWRLFNTVDSQQQLAIVTAAKAGFLDVAKYLLDEGANVNQATPGGGTAFLVASEQGNIRMLSLLISYGADPMCRDAEDRSGLEIVRHNYPGRYINFYNNLMEEYSADDEKSRYLRECFETANVRFESRFRGVNGPDSTPSHFTVPLRESALSPVQGFTHPLPKLLVLLRELFVAAGGPKRDGVFRISPDGVKVSRAKQELAANAFLEKQRVPHTVASDIDVLASLIKLYFRKLPEPLITVSEILVAPGQRDTISVNELWSRMTKKGKLFREVLRYVVDIAADVAENENVTKMTPGNMGIVFGPNVIKTSQGEVDADPQRFLAESKIANEYFAHLVELRLEERSR